MEELGKHLLDKLDSKYSGQECWDAFRKNLLSNQDLETALSNITFSQEIPDDVKCETWSLISSSVFVNEKVVQKSTKKLSSVNTDMKIGM